MRMTALVLVLAAMAGPTLAADVFVVGVGNDSCGKWAMAPRDPAYLHWIAGMWSGLNAMNPDQHGVGATLDAEGIFGEVRKECARGASTPLQEAVVKVFTKMAKAGP